MSARDIFLYLEDEQDRAQEDDKSVLRSFPRTADFFSLKFSVLFLCPEGGKKLIFVAKTEDFLLHPVVQRISYDQYHDLNTGLVRLLSPDLRDVLAPGLRKLGMKVENPLLLPLTDSKRGLIGGLLMTDPPPFDLEDPNFTSRWFPWHNYLTRKLAPPFPLVPPDMTQRLRRALVQGHRLLSLEISLDPLKEAVDAEGRSSRAWTAKFLKSLAELAGDSGGAWKDEGKARAFFLLPGKLDAGILVHQIEKTLLWPSGAEANWNSEIVATSDQLENLSYRLPS